MPVRVQSGVNGTFADARKCWGMSARDDRWFAVLAVHGVPAIGRLPVDFVLTSDVPLCSMLLGEKENGKGKCCGQKRANAASGTRIGI